MSSLRGISTILKHVHNINGIKNISQSTINISLLRHNSSNTKGLMEFFDEEKNWGATEVKSGRSWKKDELRIKSNTDLHKLWYVLLKERNMLLTMEEECKAETRLFPSPERIDKIEDSMENLEAVVRERNRAFYELETGETGERKVEEVTGPFGLPIEHIHEEHTVPKNLNKQWQEEHEYDPNHKDVKDFLRKYREIQIKKKKNQQTRDFNHVMGLLKRFPDMDMEALKEKYPDVDIKRAKNNHKSRGHFVPK